MSFLLCIPEHHYSFFSFCCPSLKTTLVSFNISDPLSPSARARLLPSRTLWLSGIQNLQHDGKRDIGLRGRPGQHVSYPP